MDLSSYRREYAAYCSAVERERYSHHAGLSPEPHLKSIRARYSDLWTREAIDELKRKLDDTPADFETERASLHALASAAQLNHLEARAAQLTEELARCTGTLRIDRGGEKITSEDATELIVRERDPARRRELAARWLDALPPCDDLRAARLEAYDDAARSLGYAARRVLYEDATGVNLQEFAARGDAFIENTRTVYISNLARWPSQKIHGAASKPQGFADSLFFRRASYLDPFFPSRGMTAVYAATMSGLGVKVERQSNVNIDEEERPRKLPRAAAFGVNPPEDVRLVANVERRGAKSYLDFFFEAGRAQHFAWVSPQTPLRHPEFIHAPDHSARDAAGFLFAGLFQDPAWTGEHLSLRATEARSLARAVALLELEDARRCCARVRYALMLDEAADARSEHLSEAYASLHSEATGFKHEPATYLLDAEDVLDSATRLRARLLAASLREHLRTRYGRRWHASRAAGDELIDIWNVGLRYHAEELARTAWGGELDFGLLAEDLKAALDDE